MDIRKGANGRTSTVGSIHESEREYFDHKAAEDINKIDEKSWLITPSEHLATLKLWGFENGLEGKKVLECGCGTGFFSVLLAKMGAEVWCFDLSMKSVELTKKRAELNGVSTKIRVRTSAFETLDYEDGFFDMVVGKNILHHIPDIREAGRQIRRVLKKEGKAIFYELSANNPILIFIRNHVIGRSRFVPKLGTRDEHPLTADEIEALSEIFDHRCKVSYPKFRFFGKFDRQIFRQRYKLLSFLLEGIDRIIYILFPPLRKYSYKILLEFTN